MKGNVLWTIGLLAVAFALRAGYSLHLPNKIIHPDAESFDKIGWNLVSQGRYAYETPTAHRPPSYPLFLAGIYKLAGHNIRAVRLAQASLGTIVVLWVMFLSRRISSHPQAPWFAGLITAVYPFFIYYESRLVAEGFLVFCLSLAVLLFMRWREHPDSLARAFLCGLALAILGLAKTAFVALGVLILLAEGGLRLCRPKGIFLLALAFATPVLAWGMRNKALFGRFLLDSHGGLTLLECVVYYDVNKRGEFSDYFQGHPLKHVADSMNEAERDAFYLAETRAFIRSHPSRYARQVLANLKDFWRFYPRQDISFPEGTRRITWISILTEPFLILAGFLGLLKTRNQWRSLYPIYGAILLLTLLHALACAQMRYRLPLMPFLIVFATHALTVLKHPK